MNLQIKYMYFKENYHTKHYGELINISLNFKKYEKVGVWSRKTRNDYTIHKLKKNGEISLLSSEYIGFSKEEIENLLIDEKQLRKEKIKKLNDNNSQSSES